MAAHRYWRYRALLLQPGGNVHAVAELVWRTVAGGAQAAVGGVILKDAEIGGFEATKAYDGNAATAWASNAYGGWIGYQFPAAVTINEIAVQGRNDVVYQNMAEAVVESSDDGATWTIEWYLSATVSGWALGQIRTFTRPAAVAGAAAPWWRVLITARFGPFVPALASLDFRAAVGGANQAAGSGGTAATSSYFAAGYEPSKAFDNNAATLWSSNGDVPTWLGFHFTGNVSVNEVWMQARNDSASGPQNFTVQSSIDGANWIDEWSVAGSVGWTAGLQRTFARPVTAAAVTALIPFRLALAGRLTTALGVNATLPFRFALAGRMETSRVMRAALALRFALAGRMATSSDMRALIALRLALAARMTQKPEWQQTDFGPDIIDTGLVRVDVNVGLGPEFGAVRGTTYADRVGIFGGITMTWDHYTVNAFTADPAWHTGGKETFQFLGGTGVASTVPGLVTLDKPIRGFTITCAQIDFNENKILAYDANDNLLGTIPFPGRQGEAGYPTTSTFDAGANLIRKLRFTPDPSDWIAWYDFSVFFDQPSGSIGGWAQTDGAPDGAWIAADAPPATVWN